MSEKEPTPNSRITDEDMIALAIERSNMNETVIDDAAARMIAAMWHGGQLTAMCGFASNGAIEYERMAHEIAHTVLDPVIYDVEAEQFVLDKLGEYITACGERPAVEGWHKLWLKGSGDE